MKVGRSSDVSSGVVSDVTELKMVTFDANSIDDLLQYASTHVVGRAAAPLSGTCLGPHTCSDGGTWRGGSERMDDRHRTELNGRRSIPQQLLKARATGVGSYRHRDRLHTSLDGHFDLSVDASEQEHCVRGLDVMWRLLTADQLLHADKSDVRNVQFQTPLTASGVLPCIVVNIGSALTVVQVNSDGKVDGFVGASTVGGMTFLGLGRLISKAKSFSELCELASRGRREAVDLTVNDVAGGEYNYAPAQLVVSSFGRISHLGHTDKPGEPRHEDLAASLLYCVVEEVAMIVSIVAKAQRVGHAVFCGSFIANNLDIIDHIRHKIRTSTSCLGHWLSMLFTRHGSYLGAIGLLSESH